MVRTIKSSVKHAARLAARTAKDEADDLERELDQEPKDLERQQQNELHLSCPFLCPLRLHSGEKEGAFSPECFETTLRIFSPLSLGFDALLRK